MDDSRSVSNWVEWVWLPAAVLAGIAAWWVTPPDAVGMLGNTLRLGVTVMLIAIPVAALLAWSLSRVRVPGKSFWEACLLVLLFMPLYMQLAAWEAGFGLGGWYSTLIAGTLSNPPLEGIRGAVWVHAMAAIPWLYWIFRLGLVALPGTWEEAASLDANPWQVFRRITLPLVSPVVLAGVLFVLIVCSNEITVTARYQFRSYAEVLYNEFVLTGFETLPLGVGPISLLLIGVLTAGLLLCRLLWPRMVHQTVTATTGDAVRYRSRLLSSLAIIIVCVMLFIPLANLLYQAGIDVTELSDGSRTRAWSFAKLVKIVASSPVIYRTELAWTAMLSQLSVLAAITFAVVVGWWVRGKTLATYAVSAMATLCYVTPGPFLGLAIISSLTGTSSPEFLGTLYADTIFAPWLALTIRCFPFAWLLVWFGMHSIPQSVLDAASSDGARHWTTLWHVGLPMMRPHLICAVVVGLAVAVGELSASVMVMPAGVYTVATRIFNLIHYGAEDQLAGLCLSCLLLMVAIALAGRATLVRLVR